VSVTAFLAAVWSWIANALPTWAPGGRGAWCRLQRRRLGSPGARAVWVRGTALPWAEWGARRGYFELRHMGELAYLHPVTAAAA
jgi:hypothetical protein